MSNSDNFLNDQDRINYMRNFKNVRDIWKRELQERTKVLAQFKCDAINFQKRENYLILHQQRQYLAEKNKARMSQLDNLLRLIISEKECGCVTLSNIDTILRVGKYSQQFNDIQPLEGGYNVMSIPSIVTNPLLYRVYQIKQSQSQTFRAYDNAFQYKGFGGSKKIKKKIRRKYNVNKKRKRSIRRQGRSRKKSIRRRRHSKKRQRKWRK